MSKRNMVFEFEKKSYSLIEFHDKFHEKLPKFVIVCLGYHGDTEESVLSFGQVLLIQAVSRQKRVMAKFKSQGRLFSLPASFFQEFSVVKQENVGRDKFLFEILSEFELPLTIRYPKEQMITCGDVSVNTSTIPEIELLERFEEKYLLGNFITDGVICTDVVSLALHLPRVRLSIIKGIKGQSADRWEACSRELEDACTFVEYDQEYGKQEIAEYDPIVLKKATSYTYVAPRRYTNIISILQRMRPEGALDHNKIRSRKPAPLPNTIEQGNEHPESSVRNSQQSDHLYHELNFPSREPKSLAEHHDFSSETEIDVETTETHGSNQDSNAELDTHPPAITMKSTIPKALKQELSSPELPQRGPRQPLPQSYCSDQTVHHYTNDVPRTEIQPTVQFSDDKQQSENQHNESDGILNEVEKSDEKTDVIKSPPNTVNKDDVLNLTIAEVGDYLTKLGLEKFEDVFRDHKVDGTLLVDLNIDMLKEDFGMKNVEALRLIKFAKEGHVPV